MLSVYVFVFGNMIIIIIIGALTWSPLASSSIAMDTACQSYFLATLQQDSPLAEMDSIS